MLPFAVGAIAQARGVQVLQPIALALFVMILALWCLLPGGFKKRGLEEAQKENEERSKRPEDEEKGWVGKRADNVRRRLGIK